MRARERDGKPIEWLPNEIERRGAFRRARADDRRGFVRLQGRNDRDVRLDDAGFFARDLGQTRAEPLLMIVIDRGEDGNDRLGGVGRVEPAAHAGFENDDFRVLRK